MVATQQAEGTKGERGSNWSTKGIAYLSRSKNTLVIKMNEQRFIIPIEDLKKVIDERQSYAKIFKRREQM